MENRELQDDAKPFGGTMPQYGGTPAQQGFAGRTKPKSLFDWNIGESVHRAAPGLTPKEKLLLRFMETTIERINACLINIHAVQEILIKKGVCSQDEIKASVNEARNLPETKIGKKVLDEMIRDFNTAAGAGGSGGPHADTV